MKETGLMFKAPLVRAILEGCKTQTRRLVKPAPAADQPLQHITTETGLVYARSIEQINPQNIRRIRWESPVGKPGDRIYVRETWQHGNFPLGPYQEGAPVFYRADYLHERDPDYADAERTVRRNWLPSIHMPKQAARIWLEITGVRVERLQQITEADCIAEGAPGGHGAIGGYHYNTTPLEQFRNLWESTGGDWSANPWVWAIDFKTISTTGRPA